MSMVCRLIGHRFQDTYVIKEYDGFYDVKDAHYCRLCGVVHSNPSAS